MVYFGEMTWYLMTYIYSKDSIFMIKFIATFENERKNIKKALLVRFYYFYAFLYSDMIMKL